MERPLRFTVNLSPRSSKDFRAVCRDARQGPLADLVDRLGVELGPSPHQDFNRFISAVAADAAAHDIKRSPPRARRYLRNRPLHETKPPSPLIKAVHRKIARPDSMRGLYPVTIDGEPTVVEHEPGSDLRDYEQVPCSMKEASKLSCATKCCPTPGTPGMFPTALGSETRSALLAIAAGLSPSARWRRYAPTS